MAHRRKLGRLEDDVGEILDSREGGRDLEELRAYRGDPVAFTREVLEGDPWDVQEDVMRAVAERDQVVWRGANALGKDWAAAALALYWVYVQRGRVLLTGPTARQVHEVVMRNELARAKRRADLPGDLYATALRMPGEDEAKIVAATATGPGSLQGIHDPNGVLAIVTEAQDVEDWVWETADACTASEDGRTLAVGNPLRPSGRFYTYSRHSSGWTAFQTSAMEHPNLDPESERRIAGGPSEGWLERMRQNYGETSPIWTARVEGDFPEEAVHGLFRRSWLEEAGKRWANLQTAGEVEERTPVRAGLDPSRLGADATVLAVARGDVLDELVVLEGRHTATEVVEWATSALKGRGIRPRVRGLRQRDRHGHPERVGEQRATGRVVVDEPGLGGPILDRLSELRFRTRGFNGGKKAGDPERFFNARAEAYWSLARRLEDGAVALPPDDRLVEELAAVEYTITGGGKVQIEAKNDLKSRLGGRSPDRADAVVLALSSKPKDRSKPKAKVFGPSSERGRPKVRP